MKNFAKFYIIVCWAFFILILISAPMPEYDGDQFTYYDKFVHIFLFGVLAFLLASALNGIKKIKTKQAVLISFLISAPYAALCEYTQFFVPGRDVSEYDLVAGLFGIVIVLFFKNIYLSKSCAK